jgi:hypothetical protein
LPVKGVGKANGKPGNKGPPGKPGNKGLDVPITIEKKFSTMKAQLTGSVTKLCAFAFQNKKAIKPATYKAIEGLIANMKKKLLQIADGKLKTDEFDDFLAKSGKDIELAKTHMDKKK